MSKFISIGHSCVRYLNKQIIELLSIKTRLKKMVSILEQAKNYEEKKKYLNIADLDKVSVNLDLQTAEETKQDGEKYNVNYIEQDNKRYRVPGVVLGDLKNLIEAKPTLQYFKVLKSGQGKEGTKYQVLVVD